jgi:hypothetical protein
MKSITLIIENFTDWGKPWTFYEYVINNSNVSEIERINFSKIYKEASKFELWNFSDLTVGVENSSKFLKENTNLSEKAIKQIVNAIAYEWR